MCARLQVGARLSILYLLLSGGEGFDALRREPEGTAADSCCCCCSRDLGAIAPLRVRFLPPLPPSPTSSNPTVFSWREQMESKGRGNPGRRTDTTVRRNCDYHRNPTCDSFKLAYPYCTVLCCMKALTAGADTSVLGINTPEGGGGRRATTKLVKAPKARTHSLHFQPPEHENAVHDLLMRERAGVGGGLYRIDGSGLPLGPQRPSNGSSRCWRWCRGP